MKEVARLLAITPRTVAFHKYSMMEDLGIRRSAELVRFAVKHHIVSMSPIADLYGLLDATVTSASILPPPTRRPSS